MRRHGMLREVARVMSWQSKLARAARLGHQSLIPVLIFQYSRLAKYLRRYYRIQVRPGQAMGRVIVLLRGCAAMRRHELNAK